MTQEKISKKIALATQYYQSGNTYEAEKLFREILSINSKDANSLHMLGCIYKDRGQLEKAIELMKASISVDASNPISLLNLGKTFILAGQHATACQVFNQSLHINPHVSETWFCFGNALKELQKFDGAQTAYKNALKLNSAHIAAASNLGALLTDLGELDEAKKLLENAIEKAPEDINLRINYGRVLACVNDHVSALAQYLLALPSASDSTELYLNIANSYLRNGDYQESVNFFSKYYDLKPIAQVFSLPLSSEGSNVSSDLLTIPPCPKDVEFIPSYIREDIPFGMHLMYVHIPKTGGVRFSAPIFDCIQEMFINGGWTRFSDFIPSCVSKKHVSLALSQFIDSEPMRDGIVTSLASSAIFNLDFSFFSPHGVSSREIFSAISCLFDVHPVRIATYRDPTNRLRSALDYLYRTTDGNLNFLREMIANRDPFLHNAIYRGCFSDFSSELSSSYRSELQVDYLIDIGDFSIMNHVMSTYLSRCRLPNIIVNKKVNVSSRDRMMDSALSDLLMDECLDSGFIDCDSDQQIKT